LEPKNSQTELLRCIEALDKRREKGGLKNPEGYNQYKSGQNLEPNNDQTEPSKNKTAKINSKIFK